ncbi:MAG: hypothetical protein IKZ50_06220 [Bacteroidales bacterium]|nr:hypothetical protein [Bacteroidales bacterium]
MPVEKLNEQYTQQLSYSLPSNGGTVTFAAYYNPVDPNLGITDLEYLNQCLAGIHADTLMTFTSCSTNLGQMWYDFSLTILPNNTYSPTDQTKAVEREIHLIFPLSTGSNLYISVSQEKGADRPEVFPLWPDERTPITEPVIDHTPNALQESEQLSNWRRKTTYIGENTYTPTDSIVDIVYYNGLGQQKQTVQVGASANAKKNIILNSQYDPMGKMIREYLPYVSTSDAEGYDTDAATKQLTYYQGLYGLSEIYPYAETVTEATTDRTLAQFSPGASMRNENTSLAYDSDGVQKTREDLTGRFLANNYSLNRSRDSIPCLMEENGNIINRGFYKGGALFKTTTTDPDGKTVATFTDENKRTILVRTYMGGFADTTALAGWSDLVYVYNKKELLAAVITPEGEKERDKSLLQISTESTWAKKRCYIYKYDALGRMISRRWPQRGEELLVVDPAGRVVASQDSLLRKAGRWLLTRYDRASKPVEVMVTQQSISESNMRGYFSYESVQSYFNQGGTAPFYPAVYNLADNISLSYSQIGKTEMQAVIPADNNQSVTLYFLPEAETVSATDVTTEAFASLLWEKSAMTSTPEGKLVAVAEADSTAKTLAQSEILYRYTAYFYDCWRRPVQTVTRYPDGSIIRASTKYNFQGVPVKQVVRITVPQGNDLGVISPYQTDSLNAILTECFTYDKRGRMLTSSSELKTFMTLQQGGALAYSDTITSNASASFSYDELGHLVGKTMGSSISQELSYNIQDWMTQVITKKGTQNILEQKLRYFNTEKSGTTPLYGGNISEWESKQGNESSSTYAFDYDNVGRLIESNRFVGNDNSPLTSFTERNISYDRNGNILTMSRVGGNELSALHDFNYSYDGDRLTSISGTKEGTAVTAAYNYDGNGNQLMDGLAQVRLSYGLNNQVFRVRKTNMQIMSKGPRPPGPPSLEETIIATYAYFADGAKFSLTDNNGLSRIYIGPFTLARKKTTTLNSTSVVTLLESAEALGAEARFAFAATPQSALGGDTTYTVDYETLYLIKDHLGSVRAIADTNGNILERNDNYPYGLRTDMGRSYPTLTEKYRVRLPSNTSFSANNTISLSSPTTAIQPYKLLYNGKELQLIAQTDLIDYGARQYNPITTRWNAPDPLSEKYYASSPYVYCVGNPIIFTDNNGETLFLTGIYAEKAFEMLQSLVKNFLTLSRNEETGEITYKPNNDEKIDQEYSKRLMEVIDDKNIRVNVSARKVNSEAGGEFKGNTDIDGIRNTFQWVDPNVLEDIEIYKKEPIGKNLMHEITESYEGGKLGIRDNTTVMFALTDIPKKSYNKKTKKLLDRHYRKYYKKAHKRATKQSEITQDDLEKLYGKK